ncbi:MAG: putative toxin-antitoxin system toxin component, PIN family [Nitrososphaerota archaeon]|nr:putative toxin-antitoxin system toxin component, PIN family [Nitrososphaerota archaeon]
MIRVVLDTNVVVSAVASGGKPRQLLDWGVDGRFQIVVSEFILKEVGTVLRRPKFKASEEEVSNVILTLVQSGDVTTVTSSFEVVGEDPTDDAILNTALDGGAEILVTGDRHLLELKEFKRTKILSVSEALKRLQPMER